jgi:hypothetical protein
MGGGGGVATAISSAISVDPLTLSHIINIREALLTLSVFDYNAALLVHGFSSKLEFLRKFFMYVSLISPGGNYCMYYREGKIGEAGMGRRGWGAKRLVLLLMSLKYGCTQHKGT